MTDQDPMRDHDPRAPWNEPDDTAYYLANQGGTWTYRTPGEMSDAQYEEILQQLETDHD